MESLYEADERVQVNLVKDSYGDEQLAVWDCERDKAVKVIDRGEERKAKYWADGYAAALEIVAEEMEQE